MALWQTMISSLTSSLLCWFSLLSPPKWLCVNIYNKATMIKNLTKRSPIKGRGYQVACKPCGPLACNLYTLICDVTKQSAIVDPAVYTHEEMDDLQEHLDGTEVTHILLTHGHSDHVAGVKEVMAAYPKASLLMHPLEAENYAQASDMGLQFGLRIPHDLPEPTHEILDGDVIKIGDTIRLDSLHTPGHSPGHVAFVDHDINTWIEQSNRSSKESVIFGGDLLFRGSVGRTDFPNSSIDDLYASLRRLYIRCHQKSIVLSGHTTPTFLNTEAESNPFCKLAIERPDEWFQDVSQRHGWNIRSIPNR